MPDCQWVGFQGCGGNPNQLLKSHEDCKQWNCVQDRLDDDLK